MKPFYILALGVLLIACNNEKPTETTVSGPPTGVDITAPDSIRETFTLPDSINTNLIIATYVEIDPVSHTVLMYSKADKKSALQVRYLDDGKVSSEKLDIVSETMFKNKEGSEFLINDSAVVYKNKKGEMISHFRTDAN